MRYRAMIATAAALSVLGLWIVPAFAQTTGAPEYVYRARPGDTLIGFAQRALVDPAKWRDLQRRNRITNPQRISVGSLIRVPQDWLRQSTVTVEVLQTIGAAQVDGRPLARGELLGEGATLTTGADGFVTLRFSDGGLLILQSGSRLIVQRLRRYDGIRQHDTQVRLEAGRASSQVTPGPAVGRFEIATPVAVSAVRGTEFRTQFDATRTLAGAEVTQGLIGVVGTGSGVVAVPAGFGSTTDATGEPSAPVRLLPAPAWLEVPTLWSKRDFVVALQSMANAVEYRAQLARDEQLREVVAQSSSTEPLVRFGGLTDGVYWIRVHAVDKQSLAGFDTVQRISVELLPEPPALALPATNAKQSGDAAQLSWQTQAGAFKSRLQLARDSGFQDLIVDVPDLSSDRYVAERLVAGSYFWRVAAVRADGNAGEWSEPRRFEQKALPVAPTARVDKRQITIAWLHEAGQTHRIQISRDPAFAASTVDDEVVGEKFVWDAGGPGKYHVRVQTTDADGYVGPWSPAASVELPPPRWIRWMPLVSVVPLLLL